METIKEVNEIPVKDYYDIIVVGAGVAGVSAALAAARSGIKVLLIEKSTVPGGLATLGLIAKYLPLCDGKGNKVIGGIAEELLHISIKYGYSTLSDKWICGNKTGPEKPRYTTEYSPPEFIIGMDELLEDADVSILYDTVFCDCVTEDKICKYIIVENKSGRQAYSGKFFIDTTGDADIMYRAGVECIEQDNYLSFWLYDTDLEKMNKSVKDNDIRAGINLRAIGTNTGKGIPEGSKKYLGTDGESVSEFIIESRKLCRPLLKKRNNKKTSFLAFPGMAQFRTTRRIKGIYTLKEEDVFKTFDDSIGCSGDWRKPGPVYEIPYRTLVSQGSDNIITAGRTISSAGDTWEVTRVIPVAAMTGHAAGKAAVIASKENISLNEINIEMLQEELADEGLIIHR